MNSRQVDAAFHKFWAARTKHVPTYATDKPAKRQAFSEFVDYLHRESKISDRVAENVELAE